MENIDSSTVDYIQGGTGAALRTVKERLQEYISVADFGAIGNGIANNTSAINAAIQEAKRQLTELYFPPGTYLITGNLIDFWIVPRSGRGVIKKGSSLFPITPKNNNTSSPNVIYVSPSGSDSNDGLDVTSPVRTLTKVTAMLEFLSAEAKGGAWRVKFAAGTYTEARNFTNLGGFQHPIEFRGEGTENNPLTIFDPGNLEYINGMYIQNETSFVLRYLKFQNYVNGYAVYARWNCKLEIYDCVADNCQTGFGASHSSYIRCIRTTAENCKNSGFLASYNSQCSFGPGAGATATLADAAVALNCGYGFHITRDSVAHVDYCIAKDSEYAGVIVEVNSRASINGGDYQKNPVAIRCWTGSWISQSTSHPIIFNQADSEKRNEQTFEVRGGGGWLGQSSYMEQVVYTNTTSITFENAGNAVPVAQNLFTIPAGWFVNNTKRIKVKAWGTALTTPGARIAIYSRIAGGSNVVVSIPESYNGSFLFETEVIPTDGFNYKALGKITLNGNSVMENSSRALDFLTQDRSIDLICDMNGEYLGSSITFEAIEVSILG